MRISSFNINKFCGAYGSSLEPVYYNPRNVDFKSKIKEIVDSLLVETDDIVFLQEFIDNQYISVHRVFGKSKYNIFSNVDYKKCKSNVVAITLKNSRWKKSDLTFETEFPNKFIKMEQHDKNFCVLGVHNTDETIKKQINECFKTKEADIILGDFNDQDYLSELSKYDEYRGLMSYEFITYKPVQSAIDQIFVSNTIESTRIAFEEVIETFASDHNVLSFELDPRARTKKYVRDQIDNIGLSLHDSRVKKIEVNDDTLILIVDGICQYQDEEETTSSGIVEFTKVDLEYFEIMVFDYPFGYDDNGSFTGRCYSLDEFYENYPNAEFDINIECYNGYDTIYQGIIWDDEMHSLFTTMHIWNYGDIIYRID